ncbi:MAG TPA: hypothetical protein V6C50_12710 [Crinalium sp.]
MRKSAHRPIQSVPDWQSVAGELKLGFCRFSSLNFANLVVAIAKEGIGYYFS